MTTDVRSDDQQATAAAIDIGSNSIKMTIGKQVGGRIEQFDWASEVVRLGEGLDRTGRLDDGRIDRAIETLRRFSERAHELGAATIVAVATEATRSAANGEEFLARVREETGIDVRVIGGDEEAALTFAGVAAMADMTGTVLVADIGGGSTELVMARDGKLVAARSIALGSGRLTDRFVASDPPSEEELVACEAEAGLAIAPALAAWQLPPPGDLRLTVVGGTGEFMARLVADEQAIDLGAVRAVLAHLQDVTAADLAAELAIPEARARVLPAGVAIVAALAGRLEPKRIEISRSGIRAGLLSEVFAGANGAEPVAEGEMPRTADDGRSLQGDGSPPPDDREEEPDFRTTMSRLIGERWAVVWKAVPVAVEGVDIEGVHDVRVASRRLRAAMDVAAPVFPHGWYRALHRAAKEITSALGEVRDRDVLLVALTADRDAAPLTERPGIDRLIDRVARERAAARVEMERFLRELLDGPIRSEAERRFGPARRAKPPRVTDEER